MKKILIFLSILLSGCVGKPENVEPVGNFDLQRYLGTWYEIARLDHRFERGLSNVTANYSLRDDGGVKVINRGYSDRKGEWKQAVGKAYFVEDRATGFLKVSFFGPFYGSYIVFELDQKNYRYAVVSGPDKSYLWILARSPKIDEAVKARLVTKAAEKGFDAAKLIYVKHE
jgi:apolipoprotein D and lipocalin family protein